MNVHILTIGDELLIGQVVDTNSAVMGQMLNEIGAHVMRRTVVGDSENVILDALESAIQKADVVLITGGLGPTKDDVTKKVLADYFGVGFIFHQETLEIINRMYEKFGRPVTDIVRSQCFVPQNATVLANKMGSAPGLWFDENGKVVVAMPGVPFEMEYLMKQEVIPRLQKRFQSRPISHRTLLTAGEGETILAGFLKEFEEKLPPSLKLAYLPAISRVRLRLTAIDSDEKVMVKLLDEKFGEIQRLLPPELIVCLEDNTLEAVVGKMLIERNLTLSTAESCTGGYLAHLITSVPGASAYFTGSVIAYSNETKKRQLGVKEETLQKHGAVSEQTINEMVKGALEILKTDIAIATSGIAGPDGGTPEKPVGTIWLAVGDSNSIETRKLQLGKDRMRNIQYTAFYALNLLRLFLRKMQKN